MRTEKEMLNLILGVAEKDDRIKAVYMNGSRTNANAPSDIFQDYDIVFVVTETWPFIQDPNWIDCFGELLVMQEPDKNDQLMGLEVNIEDTYGYLMLFKDGNRIDLHLETPKHMLIHFLEDKLTVPLLDKEGILPAIDEPTDSDYWVRKPTEAQYQSCCNDFWWCLQNVGKGIWRDELPYAKQMFELVIRARLDEMVSWWIGFHHEYNISTGKMGKYYKKYLPEAHWSMYEKTYSDRDYENFWDSIFTACELFRDLAVQLAEALSFTYPVKDDENMTQYLKHIRKLPANAKGIF